MFGLFCNRDKMLVDILKQSDPLAVIDQVAESLRRSARASLHRPPMGMA